MFGNQNSGTVDTYEMAQELRNVTQSVNGVKGAVAAMSSAVVAAEQEAATKVCENVNRGFYVLMHSQISQKIAKLTSDVEAKLFELSQYASALKAIQGRMTRDYNMISSRYSKLFRTLNNNLEMRIAELDKPVFRLVDRDIKLLESRISLNSARFPVCQGESISSSQLITASKVKQDAVNALESMAEYAKDSYIQSRKSEATMQNTMVDSMEDIFVPVSIMETTTDVGATTVNYYVASSGNPQIDDKIDKSVSGYSLNSVIQGEWEEIDPVVMEKVAKEFHTMMAESSLEDRVSDQMSLLFDMATDVQQLKADNNELY